MSPKKTQPIEPELTHEQFKTIYAWAQQNPDLTDVQVAKRFRVSLKEYRMRVGVQKAHDARAEQFREEQERAYANGDRIAKLVQEAYRARVDRNVDEYVALPIRVLYIPGFIGSGLPHIYGIHWTVGLPGLYTNPHNMSDRHLLRTEQNTECVLFDEQVAKDLAEALNAARRSRNKDHDGELLKQIQAIQKGEA